MLRHDRHTEPTEATSDAVEITFGCVRRATLNGRLYPHPRCDWKRMALHALYAAGRARYVARTAMSLGGWFAPAVD